jgi:quercetin dioxygenase-like cupin family protein
MPNQSNRIALVFDPISITNLNATFGVEVFGPGHITPQHQHEEGHELFFILSGSGVAECNGHRFEVGRGDVVVFPPKSVHGIDNLPDAEPLYCLELMLPNDMFSEFVRSGQPVGMLNAQDICTLINFGCGQLEQGSAHPQAQHEL